MDDGPSVSDSCWWVVSIRETDRETQTERDTDRERQTERHRQTPHLHPTDRPTDQPTNHPADQQTSRPAHHFTPPHPGLCLPLVFECRMVCLFISCFCSFPSPCGPKHDCFLSQRLAEVHTQNMETKAQTTQTQPSLTSRNVTQKRTTSCVRQERARRPSKLSRGAAGQQCRAIARSLETLVHVFPLAFGRMLPRSCLEVVFMSLNSPSTISASDGVEVEEWWR